MADDYPKVDRMMGGVAGWISIAVPAILFLYFVTLAPQIAWEAQVWAAEWVPSLGVALSLPARRAQPDSSRS